MMASATLYLCSKLAKLLVHYFPWIGERIKKSTKILNLIRNTIFLPWSADPPFRAILVKKPHSHGLFRMIWSGIEILTLRADDIMILYLSDDPVPTMVFSQIISKVDKSAHGWGLETINLLCVALYQGLDMQKREWQEIKRQSWKMVWELLNCINLKVKCQNQLLMPHMSHIYNQVQSIQGEFKFGGREG